MNGLEDITGVDWASEFAHHVQATLYAARQRGNKLMSAFTTKVNVTEAWLVNAAANARLEDHCHYWSHPTSNQTLLGIGAAHTYIGNGEQRFDALQTELESLRGRLFATDEQSIRWLGGFSFAPTQRAQPWQHWADAAWVIPRFLFERKGSNVFLTVSVWVQPADEVESLVQRIQGELRHLHETTPSVQLPNVKSREQPAMDRDRDEDTDPQSFEWKAAVARTAADIRAGTFTKVVLARQVMLPLGDDVSVPHVLHHLQTQYPDSFVFAVWQHGECFIGASPERLVGVQGREVSIDCLAGTTSRGKTVNEDSELGRQLLASAKDCEEHAVVLRWIQSSVEGVVQGFEAPATPVLRKLQNLQHLHTPIRGRLAEGRTVLDVAAILHPTPAVAGVPKEAAMEVIRQREHMDRGWYAGGVGWLGCDGSGELAVALRSALVSGKVAYLYAGCGIMGDSEPETEWTETRLKLRPMQSALLNETEGKR